MLPPIQSRQAKRALITISLGAFNIPQRVIGPRRDSKPLLTHPHIDCSSAPIPGCFEREVSEEGKEEGMFSLPCKILGNAGRESPLTASWAATRRMFVRRRAGNRPGNPAPYSPFEQAAFRPWRSLDGGLSSPLLEAVKTPQSPELKQFYRVRSASLGPLVSVRPSQHPMPLCARISARIDAQPRPLHRFGRSQADGDRKRPGSTGKTGVRRSLMILKGMLSQELEKRHSLCITVWVRDGTTGTAQEVA